MVQSTKIAGVRKCLLIAISPPSAQTLVCSTFTIVSQDRAKPQYQMTHYMIRLASSLPTPKRLVFKLDMFLDGAISPNGDFSNWKNP
ncbi:hypothetical protein EDB92DRAFT_1336495 [Lactarius akahatsu]|uniref:Uncharacterized protein n=1 Tax=Lactarius akahatsu TaxID=416441 RepID=A0AAD4QBG7_9AGAM|nr:hypothetical protein EDB92DRAFT_1336495 [Lactarius akahatsu]